MYKERQQAKGIIVEEKKKGDSTGMYPHRLVFNREAVQSFKRHLKRLEHGEDTIETQDQLLAVLDQISFAPSCLDMGWQWQVEELRLQSGELRGWLVNTTFRRPDTHTGAVGIGTGRKELIAFGASESAVVKTCWLLAELIVRHELMEAFLYQGVRIFDPHHSVADLSMPSRARAGNP